jgi:hypothetical protein
LNTSPDPEFVQLIAATLGVDASFVEKDWYAMRIIAALITVNTSGMRLRLGTATTRRNVKNTLLMLHWQLIGM